MRERASPSQPQPAPALSPPLSNGVPGQPRRSLHLSCPPGDLSERANPCLRFPRPRAAAKSANHTPPPPSALAPPVFTTPLWSKHAYATHLGPLPWSPIKQPLAAPVTATRHHRRRRRSPDTAGPASLRQPQINARRRAAAAHAMPLVQLLAVLGTLGTHYPHEPCRPPWQTCLSLLRLSTLC
jgi:hypothetical protein